MKAGVYDEASSGPGSIGGSQFFCAAIAGALANAGHRAEIVHHKAGLEREDIERLAGPLHSNITLRHVPFDREGTTLGARNPLRRLAQGRERHAHLSKPYDLFVYVGHFVPPFCHAPRGMLVILFPFGERQGASSGPLGKARSTYRAWEWNRRLGSYGLKAAISKYSCEWTRRRWGVQPELLYPCAEDASEQEAASLEEKENRIVSVGRFTTRGVQKRQLEMAQAFAELRAGGELDANWTYVTAGGVGGWHEEASLFERVRAVCEAAGGEALANVERARLRQEYTRAKVFWNAAGLGVDIESRPQEVEHFGIVTVEAMAAGCVPIVVGAGGQGEIVEHEKSGFVWETPEELKYFSTLLARDDDLRLSMAHAARARAGDFSRRAFEVAFLKLAAPLLQAPGPRP